MQSSSEIFVINFIDHLHGNNNYYYQNYFDLQLFSAEGNASCFPEFNLFEYPFVLMQFKTFHWFRPCYEAPLTIQLIWIPSFQ